MNNPVSFELAKLLTEKELFRVGEKIYNFYTKPNSKMFGLDEKCRAYPIKNGYKKLYTAGEHATLNPNNVYLAPTLIEVGIKLYEKHSIWIQPMIYRRNPNDFIAGIYYGRNESHFTSPYNTPAEAYESAIEYCLNKLI